jgi:small subunit ribosomal protein S21
MSKQERKPGESIESLLRRFKKQVKQDGKLQKLRSIEYYEKPSEERKRKEKAAKRRTKIQQKADELT